MKNAMKILVLGALMACLVPVVNAQRYTETPSSTMDPAIQSQQMMQSGTKYQGTVYEPFSTATPSDQSVVGSSYTPSGKGPRRVAMEDDFNETGEGGFGDEGSPIGEPWILAVLAVAFAGIIFLRRKREAR